MNWSSVFCMFGMAMMALTRPSLTMHWQVAWTSSRMCAGKRRTLQATIVTIFSHMTKDVSVFVKCDTIFRFFFWKLPQIRTYNFRKIVRQHTEAMVGVLMVLLEIYFSFQQWKNFENPLTIDKVIAMSLVYYFFGTRCIGLSFWTPRNQDVTRLYQKSRSLASGDAKN